MKRYPLRIPGLKLITLFGKIIFLILKIFETSDTIEGDKIQYIRDYSRVRKTIEISQLPKIFNF